MCTFWDHPHAYGDKVQRHLYARLHWGSSPRVWGQALLFCVEVINGEDHPHAYGDKFYSNCKLFGADGSSPRVWGQVMPSITFPVKDGIIPTRMGTRRDTEGTDIEVADHPHAYGDKKFS